MVEHEEKDISDVKEFWTKNPLCFIEHKGKPVKQIFEEHCVKVRQKHWTQVKGKPIYSQFIDYPSLAGKKVLEVGYGLGALANELIKAGAIYTGVDLSSYHYKFCSELFRDCKSATFIEGNAENLSFDNNYFDFAASHGVMHHSPDTQRCINEVLRVIKDGSTFYCMLYRKSFLRYWYMKFFKYGILRGEYLKYKSIHEVVERHTDTHGGSAGAPISRFYKDKEIRELFKQFSSCKYEILGNYSELGGFPLTRLNVRQILPLRKQHEILRKHGGFFYINAIK
jgi:ubiquinone/menaquinone biosynthesis C-methylase UbiE